MAYFPAGFQLSLGQCCEIEKKQDTPTLCLGLS